LNARLASSARGITCAALLALAAGCGGSALAPPGPQLGRNLIAFASDRNGTFDLFLYDLDGLILYGLPGLNSPTAAERRPSLGADAQVLAFATDRAGGMGDWDILIYDLARSELAPTPAINSAGRDDEPAFTGNALALVFVRDTLGVRRLRYFNGVADVFRLMPGLDAPDGFNDWAPAPDLTGARIAFVSDRTGSPGVFVYDATGDSLLDLPDLASDSTDTEPALTPDGRYLAFASTRAGGAGGFDLYLYDLQAKAFVALAPELNTAADERHPTLSSNANVISFEADRENGHGQFDVWNHSRASGSIGQGVNQSSAGMDVEPSLRWP
jgi:Tol biopolymer transport system component